MTSPDPESLKQLRTLKEWGAFFTDAECPHQGRERISNGSHASPQMLTCIRYVWTKYDMSEKKKAEILNNLNSNRKCPLFFPYNPGYSPIEHRELQREAKTHKLLLIGMLSAAAIGAIAALIGQLIAD